MLEKTYKKAIKDKKYDKVKHWQGYETKHYATTNSHEYFAETVEAFFSSAKFRNDFYPFVHSQLREFDRDGYDMVARVFQVDADKYYNSYEDFEGYHPNIRRPTQVKGIQST